MIILIALLLIAVWLYVLAGLPATEELQRTLTNVLVGTLLTVGILFVIFAGALGQLSAQHWNSGGFWDAQEAETAANNFRGFGLLSFIAGAAERVILVIRSQTQSSPASPSIFTQTPYSSSEEG